MKKDWVAEARKRVQEDFKNVGSALFTEQVKANERMRKNFHLSKTQVRKAEVQHDEWLRMRLSRLSILEVVLERRRLLGKLVWWLYVRLARKMQKPPKMVPVPGAVPAEQRAPKGAGNEVVRKADTPTVQKA
jgi:hypothetical protein